jgi:hypothetical protein
MSKKNEIDQVVRSNQELIEALKNLNEKINAEPAEKKAKKCKENIAIPDNMSDEYSAKPDSHKK